MRVDVDHWRTRRKRLLCYVMGVGYLVAGVTHFVAPDLYEQAVPPVFPRRRQLVFVSGVAELGFGLGVMHPRTRRHSAWGLVCLLVAVFPANVYMATHEVVPDGVPRWASDPPAVLLWARLPLQAILVLWAWWYTRDGDSD